MHSQLDSEMYDDRIESSSDQNLYRNLSLIDTGVFTNSIQILLYFRIVSSWVSNTLILG